MTEVWLTNIIAQFRSMGKLSTMEMNNPLLSKYWCFVKILQQLKQPVRSQLLANEMTSPLSPVVSREELIDVFGHVNDENWNCTLKFR